MLDLPYNELYELSISKPEVVWNEIAQQVVWDKSYTSVIDDKNSPTPNWFVGGEINMSYNCLDLAIKEGHGDTVAVIYESPVTNTSEKITYKQLLQSVELLAGVMVDKCGITKGDRILMYFPVIPQTLITMLACMRIGAIYSLVFGGFPSKPIHTRIQLIQPKLIVTCNIGYQGGKSVNYKDIIDKAIDMGGFAPNHCIVYNRPNTESSLMIKERDLDWITELHLARSQCAIPVKSSHIIHVMYTSGTTGEPKGLVTATGDSVVHRKFQGRYMMGFKPGYCFWAFSDFAWITGQTIMSLCPLLNFCTTVIFEGEYSSPTAAEEISSILIKHNVTGIFLSPTIIRTLRNNDKQSVLDKPYTYLKNIFYGGEFTDENTKEYIKSIFKCSIHNLWGQTETNGVVVAPGFGFNKDIHDNRYPMLGLQFKVIENDSMKECPTGSIGIILLKLPLTPTMATSFYKDHGRFLKTYFTKYPGYYDTMDSGRITSDGEVQFLSRNDDIIHVSAIRISSGEVEEICFKNENLVHAAIIPLDDPIYGQVPFGFLIKRKDVKTSDQEIINKTINLVKEHIGEFAQFSKAVIVPELPITRVTKISKCTLTSMINGKTCTIPSSIVNRHIYPTIYNILVENGFKPVLPMN